MAKLCVAFLLGLCVVAVSCEGIISSVVQGVGSSVVQSVGVGSSVVQDVESSVVKELKCAFPNVGNGGILSKLGIYINDAAFAWIDIARNTFPYVNDPKGTEALNTWIDASLKFNIAMIAGDKDEAFRLFDVCNESFKTLAPHLSKPELSAFYLKIYDEFGAVVKTKNMQQINEYMVAAYPQFREQIGCKQNDGLPLNPLNVLKL